MNNNALRSFIAFTTIAHISCSGMFTVYNKESNNSPKDLPKEVVTMQVSRHADWPTKRNIRATCRQGRDRVKIDELEAGLAALRGERKFLVHTGDIIRHKYITDSFTKTQADSLGWQYSPTAFSADGTLVRNASGGYDDLLFRSAYQHVWNNDAQLWQNNYEYLKKVFRLANALGDHDAKENIIYDIIPNNRYGLEYKFGMGLVRSAIFRKDWGFASDLIKANPYGWCNELNKKENEDLIVHIRSSYNSEIGIMPRDENLQALVELAKKQPRYPAKNHEDCKIF